MRKVVFIFSLYNLQFIRSKAMVDSENQTVGEVKIMHNQMVCKEHYKMYKKGKIWVFAGIIPLQYFLE